MNHHATYKRPTTLSFTHTPSYRNCERERRVKEKANISRERERERPNERTLTNTQTRKRCCCEQIFIHRPINSRPLVVSLVRSLSLYRFQRIFSAVLVCVCVCAARRARVCLSRTRQTRARWLKPCVGRAERFILRRTTETTRGRFFAQRRTVCVFRSHPTLHHRWATWRHTTRFVLLVIVLV